MSNPGSTKEQRGLPSHTSRCTLGRELKSQLVCHLHFQELFCIPIKTSCLKGRRSRLSVNPELPCVHCNYKGGGLPGWSAGCQVHTFIIYHFKQIGALTTVPTCHSAISSLWLSNSHQPLVLFVCHNTHTHTSHTWKVQYFVVFHFVKPA